MNNEYDVGLKPETKTFLEFLLNDLLRRFPRKKKKNLK